MPWLSFCVYTNVPHRVSIATDIIAGNIITKKTVTGNHKMDKCYFSLHGF